VRERERVSQLLCMTLCVTVSGTWPCSSRLLLRAVSLTLTYIRGPWLRLCLCLCLCVGACVCVCLGLCQCVCATATMPVSVHEPRVVHSTLACSWAAASLCCCRRASARRSSASLTFKMAAKCFSRRSWYSAHSRSCWRALCARPPTHTHTHTHSRQTDSHRHRGTQAHTAGTDKDTGTCTSAHYHRGAGGPVMSTPCISLTHTMSYTRSLCLTHTYAPTPPLSLFRSLSLADMRNCAEIECASLTAKGG
jgi:hypothetical protein